jgi:hypothetical protein
MRRAVLATALILGLSGAAPAPTSPPGPSVGIATMQPDGSIAVRVRIARGSDQEAVLVLYPGDSNYQRMIEHIGGLMPGESKPIPPWPDQPPRKEDTF